MEKQDTEFDANLEEYKTKVLDLLRTSPTPVNIKFYKVDGEIREMNATLNPDLITSTYEKKTDQTKTPNPDNQVVFDADIGEFRNFRWNNVLEVRFP